MPMELYFFMEFYLLSSHLNIKGYKQKIQFQNFRSLQLVYLIIIYSILEELSFFIIGN